MATPVLMPLMGMTMEEGIITSWLVADGDTVKAGDPVAEFETDKINAQIEAPAAGIIGGIAAAVGESIKVMAPVCYLLEPGESAPTGEAPAAPAPAAAPTPAPQPVAPPPAAVPVPPPAADGRVKATPVARKIAAERGIDLASIQGSGPGGRIVAEDLDAPAAPAVVAAPVAIANAVVQAAGRIKSSPFARKLAGEAGIDLAGLTGTGPGGRIIGADVSSAAAAPAPLSAPAAAAGSSLAFTGVRRLIADRMVESLATSAQLTLVSEADATAFVGLRSELAAQYESTLGFRLAYNDLFARIATRALTEHPHMNSRLDGEHIIQLPYVNVGLAIDQENGLVVPNVKNADAMQLIELAVAFREVIARANDGQLTLDDVTGGTFTITSLGPMDVDAFTPVLNPPEAAILGIGRIQPKPAVVENEVTVRQMLTLSLTFDHRLNDGAPAARFLQRIKQLIEHPYLLI
jgi:pyruvate dehydrogenase E2 component (dihydrolipoamide acetyltransferase)